jgi:tRNA-dihydrouridine synthase C
MILHPVPRWITPGVPAIVMAPMDGVTDPLMRALLSQRGGFTFTVTEFIRVSQSVPGVRSFRRRVPELLNDARTPSGLPVQIQLLGGDPEKLALTAQAAVEAGAPAVDLNFGCPAPTVNHHDGGATLLRYPDRIRSIVAAVRQAVPPAIPVSAKLRLGWDDPSTIHVNAERAAEGGAAWITIHARTKMQGYQPPAYWKRIGKVREHLGIPVVANGDIWSIEDLRRCREETGCEHFMLGRGAIARPSLAQEAAVELGIADSDLVEPISDTASWCSMIRDVIELERVQDGSSMALVARVKKWLNLAHHAGKLPGFDALKRMQTVEEILGGLEASGAT